jgi:hypothetical protein
VTVVIALVVAFVFDLVLFLAAYRMLSTTTSMRVRQLLPGAILGAIGWALLKTLGATYVSGQVESANALYGTLGGVIALMLLLYLAGRLYLYGAELSAVLVESRDGPLRLPAEPDDNAASAGDVGADGHLVASSNAASVADDGPPPIPRRAHATAVDDPGPRRPTGASGDDTRTRLEAADTQRLEGQRDADRGRQARTAIAFGLATAAIATVWRVFGPDRSA